MHTLYLHLTFVGWVDLFRGATLPCLSVVCARSEPRREETLFRVHPWSSCLISHRCVWLLLHSPLLLALSLLPSLPWPPSLDPLSLPPPTPRGGVKGGMHPFVVSACPPCIDSSWRRGEVLIGVSAHGHLAPAPPGLLCEDQPPPHACIDGRFAPGGVEDPSVVPSEGSGNRHGWWRCAQGTWNTDGKGPTDTTRSTDGKGRVRERETDP